MFVYKCNLFWACVNSFVDIFKVHNDFNPTNNLMGFYILHTVLLMLMLMLVMIGIEILVS